MDLKFEFKNHSAERHFQKMKNKKYCSEKLSKLYRLSFSELCLLFVILYITLIFWNSNSEKNDSPTLKLNTEYKRKYLNHTNHPTIIYWTQIGDDTFGIKHCGKFTCDVYGTMGKIMLPPNSEGVYLFYGSLINFTNMPLPRNPQKVIWALQHEESPKNVLLLMHEKALNLFNYSSTFSRYSDLPIPLHSMGPLGDITSTKYFVKTSVKNQALKEISPILYMQTSCVAPTERDEYVKELMKYQRIDSYGICLNNKPLPNHLKNINENYINNLDEEKILKFMARYKFVLAIENGVCDDYVTEKFWRAIHLGVVPIYYGAPTIRDWLPNNKSALLLDEFSSPELLSARINTLMRNDDLYEEYLQHKIKGLISNQNIIEEFKARPYQIDDMSKDIKFICFLCEKLHTKDRGVQVVTQSHYNCPKPMPVLNKTAHSKNFWQFLWETYKTKAEEMYDEFMYFN